MKPTQLNPIHAWKRPLAILAAAAATILPAFSKNVVDVLAERPEFSTLVTAVTEAGLVDALAEAEDVTIFAPDNHAFAQIPEDALADLLADKEALTNVLLYHVAPESLRLRELETGTLPTLLEGASVDVTVKSYFFDWY